MRYLEEDELLPYIHQGKEVEQFLGEFYHEGFKCFRYVSIGRDKDGYYGLVFEKIDDSDEGLESLYDFSSLEPDDLNGKEVGPFESLSEVIKTINNIAKLDSNKYLIAGQLDKEMKSKSNKK
jgi:hypothetical protein